MKRGAGGVDAEIRFIQLQILISLNVSFIFGRVTQHQPTDCQPRFAFDDLEEEAYGPPNIPK
jgi:hypothetical protein